MKKFGLLLIMVLLIGACFGFPIERTNPPIVREISWDSPYTKAQFHQSCADCHSHETDWPWYSKLGVFSWLVIHHVEEGREYFNISASDIGDADDAAKAVQNGSMPPSQYLWLHGDTKLEDPERFIAGLTKTFGGEVSQKQVELAQHGTRATQPLVNQNSKPGYVADH